MSHQPDEMIVRVRAGTTMAALNGVLAEGGQMVPLDPLVPDRATVGGVLAVGHSGVRRLRYGPARDAVLEVRFVSARGELVKAGGPVVKNVTGYDLCRLLVGSLGTLGLLAEVVMRCQPLPTASRWFRSDPAGLAGVAGLAGASDPFDVASRLYRASSVLWDGASIWVLLEGDPDDVDAQAVGVLGPAFVEVAGPPELALLPGRLSLPPGRLCALPRSPACGGWVAEVGVGTVHAADPAAVAAAMGEDWPPLLAPRVADLHRALRHWFDPDGRLNPGRSVAR
jgi:glycolate oxidase FAD binding subunit